MKIKLLTRITASLLLTGILLFVLESCKKDEVPVFDTPTIAVVADNSSPYPSDKVVFTIQVSAKGKLKDVSANGVVIKTYTTDVLTDNFTYEYTVPATASLGPTAINFIVNDKQATAKVATNASNLVVQNPDFRGNPKSIFNFQTAAPNATVKAITRDIGGNPWENAYDVIQEVADPANASNKVLQADRKGAHEWYFNGGGAVFTEFVSKLSETDMQGLVAGTRVLQMNVYFKEVKKLVTVRATAGGADIPNTDLSWKFTDAKRAWNFDLQDSTKAIPIALALGNKAKWEWNNGNPLGKKFFLVGSLSAANQWQTVTFSRRGSTTDAVSGKKFEDKPLLQSSTQLAFTDDATVGLDQIDYLSIIVNNRKTSFKNPSGYLELPGDGNGFSNTTVASIADDHNTYYIDNIRIIDAKDYNKNPNK